LRVEKWLKTSKVKKFMGRTEHGRKVHSLGGGVQKAGTMLPVDLTNHAPHQQNCFQTFQNSIEISI
jgi:hypothetical protein